MENQGHLGTEQYNSFYLVAGQINNPSLQSAFPRTALLWIGV